MRFRQWRNKRRAVEELSADVGIWAPLEIAIQRDADNGGSVMHLTYGADRIIIGCEAWTMTVTMPEGVRLCMREEVGPWM